MPIVVVQGHFILSVNISHVAAAYSGKADTATTTFAGWVIVAGVDWWLDVRVLLVGGLSTCRIVLAESAGILAFETM